MTLSDWQKHKRYISSVPEGYAEIYFGDNTYTSYVLSKTCCSNPMIKWFSICMRNSRWNKNAGFSIVNYASSYCQQNCEIADQRWALDYGAFNAYLQCFNLGIYFWAASWQNQKNGCALSEDSDQPGQPTSLMRVFAVRMKKAWVLSYPLSAQRRLWAGWADAQADLSLSWPHTYFVGFVMSRLIYLYFWFALWMGGCWKKKKIPEKSRTSCWTCPFSTTPRVYSRAA